MIPNITIDTRQFRAALNTYYASTPKSLAQVLNQRAYNVAGRTLDLLKPPPGQEQAQRSKIKSYLTQRIGPDRYLRTSTGKISRKRAKKSSQLTLANLIIQARRSKMGLKGLHGDEMTQAAGKFKTSAQVGVGFLKSPFVSVVRSLSDYVPKARMAIKTSWGRIAVWQGSKGSGTVHPALPGSWNPKVIMSMIWNVKGSPNKVDSLTRPFLQKAFDMEAREMMDHVADKLQKDANKINAGHGSGHH